MSKPRNFISIIIVLLILPTFILAGGEWYKEYGMGLKAMEKQDWTTAADHFKEALRGNSTDKKKVRTYGMHFIAYFPNRELGICYYNLGMSAEARIHLKTSAQLEPSDRATQYLKQLGAGVPPPPPKKEAEKVATKQPEKPASKTTTKETDLIVGEQTIKLVGERMSLAVLPFENKGASRDLGDIILDKMITVLWNQDRFEVMERTALDKVMAEQSLGASGVVDATTAAEIGKGIGVDAIVIGSAAASTSGALTIDARLIDTESAAIIVAQDAYSGSSDAQSVKNAVENLARKITDALPLVEGYIIQIDGDKLTLDAGRNGGLRRGMKCVIYKEGEPMKHPITGEVLGKKTDILGEIMVTESYEKMSIAVKLTIEGGPISIGDKFITK